MLPGKANRFLRSLGHDLVPVVQIGKDGISDGLVQATARALLDHELIKIRVNGEAPDDRHDSLEALAKATASDLVQVIGRTGLLYKRHPQKPRIQLPKPGKPSKSRTLAPRPPTVASRRGDDHDETPLD